MTSIIVIGKKPMNRKLSANMLYALRAMRDLEREYYAPKDVNVSVVTMQALRGRGCVRLVSGLGWTLTMYGLRMINYVDEKKRAP